MVSRKILVELPLREFFLFILLMSNHTILLVQFRLVSFSKSWNCTRQSGPYIFSFSKNSLVLINSKLNSKPYDYYTNSIPKFDSCYGYLFSRNSKGFWVHIYPVRSRLFTLSSILSKIPTKKKDFALPLQPVKSKERTDYLGQKTKIHFYWNDIKWKKKHP